MPPDSIVILPYTADDDLVAEGRGVGRPVLRVYRPEASAVVLGAASKPEIELDLAGCRAAGIPLLRRWGGGCAVVIDPGDVIVSVVHAAPGFVGTKGHCARISRWLLAAISRLGIEPATLEGSSDLALENRKFAGACIHRGEGLLHYSACLLVTPDLDLIDRCLRHPPREPAYRAGRPHRDFVRPLSAHPGGWTAPLLEQALRRILEPAELGGRAP
jgi:lipoate-protein ligase A